MPNPVLTRRLNRGSATGAFAPIQAAVFNGTTSQAVAANAADFQVSLADFGVAVWFNTTRVSGFQRLLFKGLGAGAAATDDWFLQLNGTTVTIGFSTGAGYQTKDFGTIGTGAWHLVYGGWLQGITSFVWSLDGASISTAGAGAAGPQATTQPVTLGNDPTGTSPFSGSLENAGFWKRTLTQGEIDTLWNGGAGMPMSSLGGSAVIGIGESWDLNGNLLANVHGHNLTGTAITFAAGH